jgi:ADP-heptose:LPS heptosyltransferase
MTGRSPKLPAQGRMKFLVIRFSSIGDIVQASPVLRCLKKKYPDAEVHLVTKYAFRSVTEANPYVDKFHYYKGDLRTLIRDLRTEEFDTVIDLHKNIRSLLIRLGLGKRVLSYDKQTLRKILLTQFHINLMKPRHVTDMFLDTVRPLGVEDDGEGLDHFIPDAEVLPEGLMPSGIRERYIALCIGATYATKKLPVERLVELCSRLIGPVVLVGGKEDVAEGEQIAANFPGRVINACGKCSLHQSALIVRDATLVISHDTGMQYISCALQKPVLAIWGGTSPKLRFGPYYGYAHPKIHMDFLTPGLRCQPCSAYGKKKCPKGHFDCMMKLDLAAVAVAANGKIGSVKGS